MSSTDVPWRSCPWLLERTNIRSLDPPLFCWELAHLGQRDCEAAYVSSVKEEMVVYLRCVWDPTTRKCSADADRSCNTRPLTQASRPAASMPAMPSSSTNA